MSQRRIQDIVMKDQKKPKRIDDAMSRPRRKKRTETPPELEPKPKKQRRSERPRAQAIENPRPMRRRTRTPEVKGTSDYLDQKPSSGMSAMRRQPHERGSNTKIIWLLAVVMLLVLVYSVSTLFTKAQITLTPRTTQVPIELALTAVSDAESEDQLSFSVAAVTDTVSKQLQTTGTEIVNTKAQGTIVIYNNFSSKSQRLLEETRFESPDGLIYKLGKGAGLTVPGQRIEDGRVVPGSIEATVYADQPGEQYNIGLTNFTIPGFKGSAKFNGFSASSTSDITGGFSGERPVVSDGNLDSLIEQLESDLRATLERQAKTSLLEDKVTFANAATLDVSSSSDEYVVNGDQVSLEQTGVLYTLLFDTPELSRHIAEQALQDEVKSEVRITNFDQLTFERTSENVPFNEIKTVSFTLSGVADIEWVVDPDDIRSSLLGRHKQQFTPVVSEFDSVQEATLAITPFWRKTVPDKLKQISITVE